MQLQLFKWCHFKWRRRMLLLSPGCETQDGPRSTASN